MKKLGLVLLLCMTLVVLFVPICNADEQAVDETSPQVQVTERPEFKISINGKQKVYTNVPIVVNERTLLPLREVLVNLGVPNDDKHILWNDSDRSVTVTHVIPTLTSVTKYVYNGVVTTPEDPNGVASSNYDYVYLPVKVVLKIDSDMATVNGKSVKLDASAIIYNDSTYIPARFVAESIGKKVTWDDKNKVVIIKD